MILDVKLKGGCLNLTMVVLATSSSRPLISHPHFQHVRNTCFVASPMSPRVQAPTAVVSPETSVVRLAYHTGGRFISPRANISAANTDDVVMLRFQRLWDLSTADARRIHRLRGYIMVPTVQIGIISTASPPNFAL